MKIYFKLARAKQIFLSIGIVLICTSCYEDVVDLDLSGIEKQVVIEGIITDQSSSSKVIISETSSIYRIEKQRMVSGAIVIISDDLGNEATMYETELGIYRNNSLIGVPGRTYKMEVQIDNKIYSAISKMPVPLELDSAVYSLIYPQVYRVSCYFTDHKGIQDFCRLKIFRNHEYLNMEKILYNDKYTDGKVVSIDNIHELFYLKDKVNIELLSIDKNIYDFYSVIFSQEDFDPTDQSIIDLASANPKSNISNNALGYFSAQTVRGYSILIK